MNRYPIRAVTCAVCGTQTNYHANWFLVVENRWLDRLKILSWHPALADQSKMQSVCGEQHLRVLIQHWLTQDNLDLNTANAVTPILIENQLNVDPVSFAGRLLGELAVHREPRTHVWTGSAQTLECILSALTGNAAKACAVDYSLASLHVEPPEEHTYAHRAGLA